MSRFWGENIGIKVLVEGLTNNSFFFYLSNLDINHYTSNMAKTVTNQDIDNSVQTYYNHEH